MENSSSLSPPPPRRTHLPSTPRSGLSTRMMQNGPKEANGVRMHNIAMRDGRLGEPSRTNRRQGKPKCHVTLKASHQGLSFVFLVFFLGLHLEPKVGFVVGICFGLQLGSVFDANRLVGITKMVSYMFPTEKSLRRRRRRRGKPPSRSHECTPVLTDI